VACNAKLKVCDNALALFPLFPIAAVLAGRAWLSIAGVMATVLEVANVSAFRFRIQGSCHGFAVSSQASAL
jgi:hypothetical protein